MAHKAMKGSTVSALRYPIKVYDPMQQRLIGHGWINVLPDGSTVQGSAVDFDGNLIPPGHYQIEYPPDEPILVVIPQRVQ